MSTFTLQSTRGRGILAATILASGMSFLAGTTTFIATPAIQAEFNAGLAQIQWMLNAYALTLAVFILISGSLGDHFGRRRIFCAGIGLFVFGSFISGLARGMNQLILFQTVQGLGAAMMIPGSLAIISSSFSEEQRGQAIGYWSGLAGGVAALGPFAGGWLVQTFNWPSIFLLNVPIGIIAFIIALRCIPESKNPQARRVDWIGALLIAVSLFGISYGLIQGPAMGWAAPPTLFALIGGVSMLIVFTLFEKHAKEPLVPLFLFKNPLVAGANIITLFLYTAVQGLILFLVLNLQQVQGYTPIQAGLALLPPVVLITFLSGPGGQLADRIGPRLPLITGALIVAAGMGLLIIPGTNARYLSQILPGSALFGLGMALVVAPVTKSALSVDPRYSGVASGINNGISRIAALLAIALFGAIMLSAFTGQLTDNLRESALSPEKQAAILSQANQLGNITIPDYFTATDHHQAQRSIDRSFIYGFRVIMILNAILAICSASLAGFTIRQSEAELKS